MVDCYRRIVAAKFTKHGQEYDWFHALNKLCHFRIRQFVRILYQAFPGLLMALSTKQIQG